jgi:hypothetical protein
MSKGLPDSKFIKAVKKRGSTIPEVADKLGVSYATARVRLHNLLTGPAQANGDYLELDASKRPAIYKRVTP